VTWKVGDDLALDTALWERLCAGRVLFVDAEVEVESAKTLAKALDASLEPQKSLPLRMTVVGDAEALEAFGADRRLAAQVDCTVTGPFDDGARLRGLAGRYRSLTLGLWSTPEGVKALPEALSIIKVSMAWAVAIMNPHSPAEPLSDEDRAAVVAAWRAHAGADAPKLFVHDLFLSDALGLDPWKGYAGCAAAGSLAHLDADGTLVACRTMPKTVGNLTGKPLKELWAERDRVVLREEIEMLPRACAACGIAADCRGGCPGLADSDGRDGSCPGPAASEA